MNWSYSYDLKIDFATYQRMRANSKSWAGTSLMNYVDYCQEFLVVGKEFIVFMKDKLEDQGEIYPGDIYYFIFVSHNGKRFNMPF